MPEPILKPVSEEMSNSKVAEKCGPGCSEHCAEKNKICSFLTLDSGNNECSSLLGKDLYLSDSDDDIVSDNENSHEIL
jgi:hypothetical protein